MPRKIDTFYSCFFYKIDSALNIIRAFRKYFMGSSCLYPNLLFSFDSFDFGNLLEPTIIEGNDRRLRICKCIDYMLHAERGSGKSVYENNDLLRLFRPPPQSVQNEFLGSDDLDMKTGAHTDLSFYLPAWHKLRAESTPLHNIRKYIFALTVGNMYGDAV